MNTQFTIQFLFLLCRAKKQKYCSWVEQCNKKWGAVQIKGKCYFAMHRSSGSRAGRCTALGSLPKCIKARFMWGCDEGCDGIGGPLRPRCGSAACPLYLRVTTLPRRAASCSYTILTEYSWSLVVREYSVQVFVELYFISSFIVSTDSLFYFLRFNVEWCSKSSASVLT